MASDTPRRRESEEQSIKARKKELFEEKKPEAPVSSPKKPARVYLMQTPPTPLSTGVKATLYIVGVVVLLLFLAALMTRGSRPSRPRASSVQRIPVIDCEWIPSWESCV